MFGPWMLAIAAAAPNFGPGLYRGEVLIPTGTVSVTLTLRAPLSAGFVDIPAQRLHRYPLGQMTADGPALRFSLAGQPGDPRFVLKHRRGQFRGLYSQGGRTYQTVLRRISPQQRVAEAMRGARAELQAALRADGSPGLAYGVVLDGHRGGGAVGVHGVGNKAPVTAETPFALYQATRSIIAVAAAERIQTSASTWSTRVTDVLAQFRLKRNDGGLNTTIGDLVAGRIPFAPHLAARATVDGANVLARIGGLPLAELNDGPDTDWPYAVLGRWLAEPSGQADGVAAISERFIKTYAVGATFTPPEGRALQHVMRGAKVVAYKPPPEPLPAARGLWGSARASALWLQMHLDGAILDSNGWTQIWRNQKLWVPSDRRGHRVRTLESRVGGSSVAWILAPDDQTGVAVLVNRGDSALAMLAAEHLLARLVGLPPRHTLAAAAADAHGASTPSRRPKRVRNTRPAHRLVDYAGRYVHAGYGTLVVALQGKTLRVRLGAESAELQHWHYDTFVSETAADTRLPAVPWTFMTDAQGAVVSVVIPLERRVPPLRFVKTQR